MTLLAGFGIADITPSAHCELNGYIARKQPALGISHPLFARTLMLTDGHTSVVIAACDLLGFSVRDSQRLEAQIAKAAKVPEDNVFLACTHTHSGPMSVYLGKVGRYDGAYVRRAGHQLVKGVRKATNDLRPVETMRIGTGTVPKLGMFRCAADEPWRGHWPGRFTTVQLTRKGGGPVTLASLGMHATVCDHLNRYIHPDYPGVTCDLLEKQTGGVALFLPGCGADVQPLPPGGRAAVKTGYIAKRLTAGILKSLRRSRATAFAPLCAKKLMLNVSYGFCPSSSMGSLDVHRRFWQRGLESHRWPKRLPFPVRMTRLGRLVLVGMPAELFHDTGADLARLFPRHNLVTISQTGGDVGYMPRQFAYKCLTYEAALAHMWYGTAGAMKRGIEARIRGETSTALRRLLRK